MILQKIWLLRHAFYNKVCCPVAEWFIEFVFIEDLKIFLAHTMRFKANTYIQTKSKGSFQVGYDVTEMIKIKIQLPFTEKYYHHLIFETATFKTTQTTAWLHGSY